MRPVIKARRIPPTRSLGSRHLTKVICYEFASRLVAGTNQEMCHFEKIVNANFIANLYWTTRHVIPVYSIPV